VEKTNAETKTQEIAIVSDYITIGQLLKFAKVIDEGGMAKWYLSTHDVLVNGVAENRRGRKLRSGDAILLPDGKSLAIAKKQ
jgi:ribosome-associated protein